MFSHLPSFVVEVVVRGKQTWLFQKFILDSFFVMIISSIVFTLFHYRRRRHLCQTSSIIMQTTTKSVPDFDSFSIRHSSFSFFYIRAFL